MEPMPAHETLGDTLRRFIDREVDPHVDAWQRDEIFPTAVH